jgi:hypothetical protein
MSNNPPKYKALVIYLRIPITNPPSADKIWKKMMALNQIISRRKKNLPSPMKLHMMRLKTPLQLAMMTPAILKENRKEKKIKLKKQTVALLTKGRRDKMRQNQKLL